MKSKTWEAQIFCGLRKGYSSEFYTIEDLEKICQEYVDEIGWCVTVTPTKFIYKKGNEPGAIIGVILYPRFPLEIEELKARVQGLAYLLMVRLG